MGDFRLNQAVEIGWMLAAMGVCLAAGCADRHAPDGADVYFGDAHKAFAAGELERALGLVSKSIDEKPTAWAYALRAKIHVENKDFAKAQEDAKRGLALEPENRELKWLAAELNKPPSQQFVGPNRLPPSATK
jgi:predicted Zn-dependent protease